MREGCLSTQQPIGQAHFEAVVMNQMGTAELPADLVLPNSPSVFAATPSGTVASPMAPTPGHLTVKTAVFSTGDRVEQLKRKFEEIPSAIPVQKLEDLATPSGDKSNLKPISCAVVIELCAGSAGLTAAIRSEGLDGLAVDSARNIHRPKAPIIRADLSSESGQRLILDIVEKAEIVHIHAGPPCGTSTKSREIPISKALRAAGAPQPKPLRSAEWPWGLPSLQGINRARVETANRIYLFVIKCVLIVFHKGGTFSIENPWRSWFWALPPVQSLLSLTGVFDTLFDQCTQGGERPVRRRWRSNVQQLNRLSGDCPGVSLTHVHKPFTIRLEADSWKCSTAEEAVYPPLLCKTAASAIKDSVVGRGFVAAPTAIHQDGID